MPDFTKQGRAEAPRMAVLITGVDVAAKTASGIETQNNSPVMGIDLSAQHSRMIDWPRLGEHWVCTKVNEAWFLDYKMSYGNDGFQKEAHPGDSVLVTDGTVLIEGSAVRLNDATEDDIITSLRASRDALRASLYGDSSRTQAPAVEVQLAADYALPSADALIPAANWAAPNKDTDGGWQGNTYRVPVTGRYDCTFSASMVSPNAGTMVAWLNKNGTVGTGTALAQMNSYQLANTGSMPSPRITTTFTAGDVVYMSGRGDVASCSFKAINGQARTRFTMTWIGPA